ncbi:peptidase C14 caspase catalytic subunit p20 [Haliangium ochraceum DSM 14365]|uniref:Peptidase C14 caspase catalytic subunit p20 n=2 Tax=Haliangium ochraceum TaxID=80816 RepID=D0LG39_HALO1|nr:peptidase C14 caspase catalytic subunit p20 [Haliangium ochraceum DSM 14365]
MHELFTRLGFACIRLVGDQATRSAILDELRALRQNTQQDDAVVVYFSGHGGRVINTDRIRDPRAPDEVPKYHQYLVPEEYDPRAERFTGLLDIELSLAVAAIPSKNLTIILDCCHSGGLVRAEGERTEKGLDPAETRSHTMLLNETIAQRLRELEDEIAGGAAQLASDAAPHLVRIEATRSDRSGFEQIIAGRRQGVLTAVLADVLERHQGQAVTWEALAPEIIHRIQALTGSEQHAHIDGPIARLPFSLDAAPAPGSLGLVRDADGNAWIHGGALYGVELGARYAVLPAAARTLAASPPLTEVEVVELTPDRARVRVCAASDASAEPGSAELGEVLEHAADTALRVFPVRATGAWGGVRIDMDSDTGAALAASIAGSPSLRLADAGEQALASVSQTPGDSGHRVEIRDQRGVHVATELNADEVPAVLERLQRAAVLRGQRSGREEHTLPDQVELQVLVHGGKTGASSVHAAGETVYPRPLRLPVGAELRCEIHNRNKPVSSGRRDLYVTVFDIDFDGRVTRRSHSESSGIAVGAGGTHVVGRRGHVGTAPLLLSWPAALKPDAAGLRSLVAVVADRPHRLDRFECLALGGYSASLTPSLLDGLVTEQPTLRRGGGDDDAQPMRYALLRVDLAPELGERAG